MAVTDANIQTLILLEVGDTDAGTITTNMALIWSSYADKAFIAPRLQELYTKRRCIDVAIASLRQQVDFETPSLKAKQDQQVQHLQDMRKDAQAEIAVIEKRARGNRAPVVASITTVEPVSPPTTLVAASPADAGAPTFTGSPYWPLLAPVR